MWNAQQFSPTAEKKCFFATIRCTIRHVTPVFIFYPYTDLHTQITINITVHRGMKARYYARLTFIKVSHAWATWNHMSRGKMPTRRKLNCNFWQKEVEPGTDNVCEKSRCCFCGGGHCLDHSHFAMPRFECPPNNFSLWIDF